MRHESRSSGLCWLATAVLLTAAACGGGGGGGSDVRVFEAPLLPSVSGSVSNDAVRLLDATAVGDYDSNVTSRAFYTFNTANLPPGARIESAVFATHQRTVVESPYATLGVVVVDHVDAGPSLDPVDYGGGILSLEIGTLSTSPAVGSRSLDVASSVRANRDDGQMWSTFRLRFQIQTDGDGISDMAYFSNVETALVTAAATLVIRYTLP